MIETHVGEVLHVLLDDLRDVLDPLGGGLRGVGERLPAPVDLGQRPLEGGWGPRSLGTPVMTLRRKFLYFWGAVGGHVGAEGGGGEEGALLLEGGEWGGGGGRHDGADRADRGPVGGRGQAAGHVEREVRALQKLKIERGLKISNESMLLQISMRFVILNFHLFKMFAKRDNIFLTHRLKNQ